MAVLLIKVFQADDQHTAGVFRIVENVFVSLILTREITLSYFPTVYVIDVNICSRLRAEGFPELIYDLGLNILISCFTYIHT